jgi:UDP-N-acetylglucosamine 3-dehydrogenase
MKRVDKVGVAGLGHMGKRHLAQYKALGYAPFTADPRMEEAEALSLGSAGHYRDFGEMLEKERPDAVSVCLPSFMHRESALAAFARRADVLMEKPFALTLGDIDDMLAAAAASGRRIMVAHVCRFMAQYAMAKETVESGRLGKPVFLNAWRNGATPGWSAQNWLGDRNASGGTVMDLQIHEIDLAQWLLGPVREAALTQRQTPKFEGSGFFHAVSALSFGSGAAAVLEAGHLMEFAQAGRDAGMRLFEEGKTTDLSPEYTARCAGNDPYRDEIRHFISCVESGGGFLVTPDDARRAVETALRLSANETNK